MTARARQYRHQYIDRDDRQADSETFRSWLYSWLRDSNNLGVGPLIEILSIEFGHRGDTIFFLDKRPVEDVLSAISEVFNYLVESAKGDRVLSQHYLNNAVELLTFVARVFSEDHLAYTVDEKGKVHPLVDQEFQRNRRSALEATNAPRYEAVRNSLEGAFAAHTAKGFDTTSAVRNISAAAESIFKLVLAPANPNLTAQAVEDDLRKIIANLTSGDPSATKQANLRHRLSWQSCSKAKAPVSSDG